MTPQPIPSGQRLIDRNFLLLFLALHLNLQQELERLLDWIAALGTTPRGHYP